MLESITFKFEDVIRLVQFEYWQNGINSTTYDTNKNPFRDWTKQDIQRFGRCFILLPSIEQTQYGIKTIELQLHVGGTIFIHNIGILILKEDGQKLIFD